MGCKLTIYFYANILLFIEYIQHRKRMNPDSSLTSSGGTFNSCFTLYAYKTHEHY